MTVLADLFSHWGPFEMAKMISYLVTREGPIRNNLFYTLCLWDEHSVTIWDYVNRLSALQKLTMDIYTIIKTSQQCIDLHGRFHRTVCMQIQFEQKSEKTLFRDVKNTRQFVTAHDLHSTLNICSIIIYTHKLCIHIVCSVLSQPTTCVWTGHGF